MVDFEQINICSVVSIISLRPVLNLIWNKSDKEGVLQLVWYRENAYRPYPKFREMLLLPLNSPLTEKTKNQYNTKINAVQLVKEYHLNVFYIMLLF